MKILKLSTLIGALILTPFVATAYTNEMDRNVQRAETKAEKAISDTVITAKIKELYLEDKDISSLKIHVTTKNQIVYLTGDVHTDYEKKIATNLAKGVKGVKEVKCRLKVLANG